MSAMDDVDREARADWLAQRHDLRADAMPDRADLEGLPLTGDCSIDCLEQCAYPGQFSECDG